jgi:hypothetical protein
MALPRRHAIFRTSPSRGRRWIGNLDRHDYGPGTAFLILYPKSTSKYRSSDQKLTISPKLNTVHAIIGLLLFASIWLIAFGGWLQHLAFRKYKRRTIIGYVHMWAARAILTLAFINGGLGLALAGSETGEKAAYGVVAALVWLGWMGITFFWPGGKK